VPASAGEARAPLIIAPVAQTRPRAPDEAAARSFTAPVPGAVRAFITAGRHKGEKIDSLAEICCTLRTANYIQQYCMYVVCICKRASPRSRAYDALIGLLRCISAVLRRDITPTRVGRSVRAPSSTQCSTVRALMGRRSLAAARGRSIYLSAVAGRSVPDSPHARCCAARGII
jgi:hypothetical protein